MKRLRMLFLLILFGITDASIGQELEQETPCTGGMVVNFDKKTDRIIETECDSLKFLAAYIQSDSLNFIVLGIYSNRENEADKNVALKRATRVKKELIKLGVAENRLSINFSYFKAPGKDDHHDWPFYPPHFTYQIGVYIQRDY